MTFKAIKYRGTTVCLAKTFLASLESIPLSFLAFSVLAADPELKEGYMK